MRVVAENSEAEIAKRQADILARAKLRELAANLLRVIRGAGKPWDIGPQAAALVAALHDYKDAAGTYPSADLYSAALRLEECTFELAEEELLRVRGQELIVSGSLQVAASSLLGQLTQQRAGERELHDGLRLVEESRELTRKKWAAPSAKPARPRAKRSARKPKTPKAKN